METNYFTPNTPSLFTCNNCNFKCSKNSDWDRHLSTAKHKRLINTNDFTPKQNYTCNCGKIYKHTSTLYTHKKICNYLKKVNNNCTDKQISNTEELIKYLMKENSEFKHLLIDQNRKLLELTKEVFIDKCL